MTTMCEVGRSAIRRCRVGVGLLALSALPLVGQAVPINETLTLRPNASVELSVISHSLAVEGWDRNEIQITGEYDAGLESLDVGGSAQSFRFEIGSTRDGRNRRQGSAELRVRLPRSVRLAAETISGSVTVGGVAGTVQAGTISGTVEIEGDLQSVEIESVSGAVRIEGSAETIDATSVSGRVELDSSVPVQSLDAESVSGRVSYSGGLTPGGTIQVESHSGSVVLALETDTNAAFDLSTFSGEITTDIPESQDEVRSRSRFTSQQSLRFMTGTGLGQVEASSFSGSIRIQRISGTGR